MSHPVEQPQFFAVVIGLMFFSVSLHLRKPGKDLEYGGWFGLAYNLNSYGKFFFTIGLALIGTSTWWD